MLRIILQSVKGGQPFRFRIVVTDGDDPGRLTEILGSYDPSTEPATIKLKEDRINQWMMKGATPSDAAVEVFKMARFVAGAYKPGMGISHALRILRGRGSEIWNRETAHQNELFIPMDVFKATSILAQDYINLMASLLFINRMVPSKNELLSFFNQIDSNPSVTLSALYDAKLVSHTSEAITLTQLGHHIVSKLRPKEYLLPAEETIRKLMDLSLEEVDDPPTIRNRKPQHSKEGTNKDET